MGLADAAGDAPRGASDPEACMAAAGRALCREAWGEAEAWLRRALARGSRTGAACADLAFVLTRMGRHDEALPLFEEAVARGLDDAETFLEAARAALAVGRSLDLAEAWLVEALERSPSLVVDVETAGFSALWARERVEDAIVRAWTRIREGRE